MTTSARQEPTRAAGAGSAVRFSGPEGISSTEVWLRRIIARLIDIVPVAVLFAGLWISGSDVLSTKPDACDPAPAPNCNVAAQTDRVDDAGNVIIEYTMLDDRVIDSGHATYQVLDTVYIADPPKASTYLVTLIYVFVVFVVLQGVTGWTPGKLIAGLRLADEDRRSTGIARSFVRWALPDGAIGIVGVVLAVVDGPWPLRVLSVFAALGALRFLGSLLPLLGPLADERLGVQFVASADYVGGRPERDDEFDLRDGAGEDTRAPMQAAPMQAAPMQPAPAPRPTPITEAAPAGAPGGTTAGGGSSDQAGPAPTGAGQPSTAAGTGGSGAMTLPIIGTPGVGRPSGSPPVFPGVPDAGTPAAREAQGPKLTAVPDLPPVLPSVFDRAPGAGTGASSPAEATSPGTPAPSGPEATATEPTTPEAAPIAEGGPTAEGRPTAGGFSRPLATSAAPALGAIPGGMSSEQTTEAATEPETPAEVGASPADSAPTLIGAAPLGPNVGAFPAPPLADALAADPMTSTEGPQVPTPAADATAPAPTTEDAPADPGAAASTATRSTEPVATPVSEGIGAGAVPAAEDTDDRTAPTPGPAATAGPDEAAGSAAPVFTDVTDADEPAVEATDVVAGTGTDTDTSTSTRTPTADVPASEAGPTVVSTTATTAAANPYPPQWDAARQAYICWEPVSAQWLQWDDAGKSWGPISQ